MQHWLKHNCFAVLITVSVALSLISCKNQQPSDQQLSNQQCSPIKFENPSQGYAAMSRLFAAEDGLYMSWVEQIDSLATLKFAKFDGTNWTKANTIASGTDWFVNWADFPAIAVNDGNIFAHYLQKSAPDTYTYDIKYKVYNTLNGQWSEGKKLHTDTTKSEHGFVSVIPYGKGGFMASWLDGRNTVHVPDSLRQMTLRAGIVNADASLGLQWQLDERVCDCCATSIAQTPDGPMVVYRDRSPDEIRDIYSVQFKDSLWTQPKVVYKDDWHINGCPVNGPSISSGGGVTAVSWFTNANDNPLVKMTTSKDSGKTYGMPYELNYMSAVGRVATVVDSRGWSYTIFMSDDGMEQTWVRLDVEDASQKTIKNTNLFGLSSDRASGFPQVAVFNQYLYVSYTNSIKEKSEVKTLKIPLEQIEFLKE